MTMTLVWIAIAGLTAYYCYREYGDVLKMKREKYPSDDQARRLAMFMEILREARWTVSILDYRASVDPVLYENGDVVAAVKKRLEASPDLRLRIALAAPAKSWLTRTLEGHPRVDVHTRRIGSAGNALIIVADDGALAYAVGSWGRANRIDCRETGPNARRLVLGTELATINELFGESAPPPRAMYAPEFPEPPVGGVGARQSRRIQMRG